MKKKLLTGAIIATIAIAGGCQAADEGAAPNNRNVDQMRYGAGGDYDIGTSTGEGMLNVRNHTLERDADRFQNRTDRNLYGNDNRITRNIYGTRNENRDNVNRVNDNRNETRYEVSKEAANKISDQVKEIDNVFVLTTENNAYVAAELDTDRSDRKNRGYNVNNQNRLNDELSDEVKQEIAKIVKSVDNDIDNVYVSTNPDFFDLTNNYANDIERGQPVRGFFDQFSNMIERLFPENQTR